MTAQWIYDINLSIQCSTNASSALRLFMNSLSTDLACKLFFESSSEYQAFVDFYLDQLRSAIKKSNESS